MVGDKLIAGMTSFFSSKTGVYNLSDSLSLEESILLFMVANTMAYVTYSTTLECDCWYTIPEVAQLVNRHIKDHPELQVSELPLHHAFHY